jgi:hypothetical protein
MRSAECRKAAEKEPQRPNVGLAKETKEGQKTGFRIQEPEGQERAEAVPGAPSFAEATEDRPGAVNPGESRSNLDLATIKANQGQTTDWDESNQIYWTKEELASLAELRRRRQNGGNPGATDLTQLTARDEKDNGAELKVQSPKSKIQGQESDVQGSISEVSSQLVSGPKLTARERADNARSQMLNCTRPFDLAELERLYAEAKKEEGGGSVEP